MGNSCQPPVITRGGAMDGVKRKENQWIDTSGISGDTASTTSSRTWATSSLHTVMTREHREDRDVYRTYEVTKLLGVGSMGTVSLVRKRKESVGGSARIVHQQRNKPNVLQSLLAAWLGRRPNALETIGNQRKRRRAVASTSSSIPGDGGEYDMLFALKTIHLRRLSDPRFLDELKNEIEVLKSLDHPNIVRAIETFTSRRQLCIVMELLSGGDLYQRDPYTEEAAAGIVKSLLSAVAYMHRHGIMHRDIKYENILFETKSDDARVKLVDFGLSKKYASDAPHLYGGAGTVYTVAPQVLEGVYTYKADLWSVGVVAYMLLSSEVPFLAKKRHIMCEKIRKCDYSFEGSRWQYISDEAKELVAGLLMRDEDDRPSADEALHGFAWLDGDFFKSRRRRTLDGEEKKCEAFDVVAGNVRERLAAFSKYTKIKKLSLMVIAHKSTSGELGLLREAFARYDVGNTGEISYPEFRAALENFDCSENELKAMFQGVDLDGSGYIDYTEFLAATLEANGTIVEERLAEAFDRLDCDDSGYISKANLRSLLTHGFEGRELSEALIQDIIDEADITKDGIISYIEFLMLWDRREEDKKGVIEKMSKGWSSSSQLWDIGEEDRKGVLKKMASQ